MAKEKKDKNFIHQPVYEGGPKAMREFIRQHLKYPEEALRQKVEGTVVLTYTIDHQGVVTDARVISGLGYGCDEEAVRLAGLLRFQVPKHRKLRVLFHKKLQVHFRLPKPAEPKQTAIHYIYQQSASPQGKAEESPEKDQGYTYTITINP